MDKNFGRILKVCWISKEKKRIGKDYKVRRTQQGSKNEQKEKRYQNRPSGDRYENNKRKEEKGANCKINNFILDDFSFFKFLMQYACSKYLRN